MHTACVFTVLTALGGATKRLDRQGLIGPVNGTIVELIAEVNTGIKNALTGSAN
ncbi:hypothetical protein N8793_07245 [Pseudomonadales bacterium]|nr:hypothetical protein [Pseudomonadales bacterium]